MKQVHPYYLIEELCREQGYNIKLLKGSLDYASFIISQRQHAPTFKKRTPMIIIYGTVLGTDVTLGVATMSRTTFSLKDPDSILKIKEFLDLDDSWRLPKA